MKVLFVCSGNRLGIPGSIVSNQAESLRKKGIQIDFFTIKGKGISGYISNVPLLRKYFNTNHFDIVHAHYSASAFTASLSGRFPLVVSLMGSDAYMPGLWSLAAKFFYRLRWNATIVKSREMKKRLGMKSAHVIPNGVDLDRFLPISKAQARKQIGYSGPKKLIIFVADPARKEKDFNLAKLSVEHLRRSDIKLMPVFNVAGEKVPYYMNAADLLLLTSKWEGSVNVVKEAMACNLPIVSTDVGDVKENLTGVKGCFICNDNPEALAEGINKVLQTESETNGREKIISLGLDSESVAKKIISVYKQAKRNV